MELKRYKKYNNGADMPTAASGFVGSLTKAFGLPEDVPDEGTTVGYAPGFSYTRYKMPDEAAYKKMVWNGVKSNMLDTTISGANLGNSIGLYWGSAGGGFGAAVGAVAGLELGYIGGIGQLISGNKKLNRYKTKIQNLNSYNMSSAHGDYLQNQYALDYGDLQGLQILTANRGKDLIRPKIRRI